MELCQCYKYLKGELLFCKKKSKSNGYCGYHKCFEVNELKNIKDIEQNWIYQLYLNNPSSGDNIKMIQEKFIDFKKKYISENIINRIISEKKINNFDIKVENKVLKTPKLDEKSQNIMKKIHKNEKKKQTEIQKMKKPELLEKLNSFGFYNIKGNVLFLKQKLEYMETFMSNISNNLKPILLIQSIWRRCIVNKNILLHGNCVYNKNKCNNETDFCTLENYNEIDNKYFYSYKDIDNFYYWFDIRSLVKLRKLNKLNINPYTRNKLSEQNIKNIEYAIHCHGKIGTKLQYIDENIYTKEQLHNQKLISVFQSIDELNYNTNIDWFNKLNFYQLKVLYKEIEDIWNYRAQLTDSIKKKMVGNKKVFSLPHNIIKNIKSIQKLRDILIDDIKIMVTEGDTREDCILGATYILSGLAIVSKQCAESYPFLLQ